MIHNCSSHAVYFLKVVKNSHKYQISAAFGSEFVHISDVNCKETKKFIKYFNPVKLMNLFKKKKWKTKEA